MENIETIRSTLTDQQREVITSIWNYYLENSWKWPPTRLIHQLFEGKVFVQDALSALPDGAYFIDESSRPYTYRLFLFGILLTNKAEEVERLLANYLKFALKMAMADANRTHISSKEAQQALEISSFETDLLGQLLLPSPFRGGGNYGNHEWNIGIPDDIEDLPDDVITYIRMAILRLAQKRTVSKDEDREHQFQKQVQFEMASKNQHPWQEGTTELIEFALDRMHMGSDFDRRLAFLILDVGVETLFKTYLTLPDSVMEFQIKRSERFEAVAGNFHDLLRGVQNSNPKKAARFKFSYLEHYHNLRNTLYHQGNQVTAVPMNQLKGYARLAVELLNEYLDVDLSNKLNRPEPIIKPDNDPVVDSAELEVSFGRFRIERLKSQSIRVLSLDTNAFETPVKPFLRTVIEELSLPIEFTFKSGKEKNTRILGKDIIEEVKSNAWHGWVSGQKVRRDTLVSTLTGRLREGKVDQKNWEIVDYIRSLQNDVLVFQPVGKGVGNSPFNLNCWYTESGKPIKRE